VAEVAEVLERSHKYSHADALTASAVSDGSVSRALDLDSGEFAEARSDAERLLEVAARDPRTRLERGKDLLKGGPTPAAEREHLTARLQAMTSVLRDIGLLTSGADERLLGQPRSPPRTGSVVALARCRSCRTCIYGSRPRAGRARRQRRSQGRRRLVGY
jgi:hypothetical protein